MNREIDRSRMMPDISENALSRTTTEQHGAGVLSLVDRMPEEATGYLLAHNRAIGPIAATARRVAPLISRFFLSTEPEVFDPRTADENAVWARPLPSTGAVTPWRRGRLRVEPDALVFEDEPDADLAAILPARTKPESSIERALVDSDKVRAAARASELWCCLLYATLNATAWRHRVSGHVDRISGRSLGTLVAMLSGEGNYLDWYAGPNFGQDERILTLIHDLGWEPMVRSDVP